MRQLLLPATIVALIVAFALLLFFDRSAPDTVLSAGDRTKSPDSTVLAEPVVDPPEAPIPDSVEPAREPAEFAGDREEAATPMARLRGVVVDSSQSPVEGFELQLFSIDGTWRQGLELPVIEAGRWPRRGFKTLTDTAGAFAFEVPVPTSDWTAIHGDSVLMLGITGRNFGPAGGRNEPRLVEGDNDLGTLVVALAGALTGMVTDSSGQPVEGADVRLESSHPGGYGVTAQTGADGRYVIGHLPAGPARLRAIARGTLGLELDAPQDVRLRETLPGPDFVLERAPTISGIVVDTTGAPVEGVYIQGWPVGSGSGGGARSGTDGRFTMDLPQDEPYSLQVDRDPRFRRWGGHSVAAATFEPGETNARIELERVERMTLIVIDGDSGEPVERLALFAGEVGGYQLESILERGDFPGGRVELYAAPGPRQRVYVRSPTHVPFEAELAYDEGEERQQTIRLVPGASLSGRALFDGEPLSAVMVTVVPERLPKEAGAAVDPDDWWGDSWKHDVPDAARHPRSISTNADGRFGVHDLAPGTYRVELVSARTTPHALEMLTVPARGAQDLGDIALIGGATLRCTLLLAEGRSPVGLTYVGGMHDTFGLEITRADGRFELSGLSAGEHAIEIRADGQRLLEPVVRKFTVAEGEMRDVTIDLRGDLPSLVRVAVESAGKALAGVTVQLVELDDADAVSRNARPRPLGTTDSSGIASGNAPSGRRVRAVALNDEFVLGHTEPFVLLSGEHPTVALMATVGTLALEFPADLELPELGTLMLRLRPLEGSPVLTRPWMFWHGHTPKASQVTTNGVWDAARVEVGHVGVGRYQLLLGTWSGGMRGAPLETLRPDLDIEIEVRAGEECTVPVPLD